MPRKSRRYLRSCFYHIMSQGLNKEYIFKTKDSMELYKKLMYFKRDKLNINILAYCIMNNHVHILINTDTISDLSKYMQKINSAYSNYYNRLNNRVGYVFRDRFRSEEILTQRQLFNCLRYIHYNPVKAKMVLHPKDYKYFSYNEFLYNKYIITNQSIKTLFENCNNYKKAFLEIHKPKIIEEETFFDVKELEIQDFIKKYEIKNNIRVNEIVNNNKLLGQMIKEARKETNVTIRQLAEILKMSKSKICKYGKINVDKRTVPLSKEVENEK